MVIFFLSIYKLCFVRDSSIPKLGHTTLDEKLSKGQGEPKTIANFLFSVSPILNRNLIIIKKKKVISVFFNEYMYSWHPCLNV